MQTDIIVPDSFTYQLSNNWEEILIVIVSTPPDRSTIEVAQISLKFNTNNVGEFRPRPSLIPNFTSFKKDPSRIYIHFQVPEDARVDISRVNGDSQRLLSELNCASQLYRQPLELS